MAKKIEIIVVLLSIQTLMNNSIGNKIKTSNNITNKKVPSRMTTDC